jgi:hypothetical protein
VDHGQLGSQGGEQRCSNGRKLAGATGLEPAASCVTGSCEKSILLVRLGLFYVMVHGFGPNLAVVGPKLDPSFFFANGQTVGRRVLRSLSVHIRDANDYTLAKRPCCPSDRIESHRNVLRVQQAI